VSSGLDLNLLQLVEFCNAVVLSVNFDFYKFETTAALYCNFSSTSVQIFRCSIKFFLNTVRFRKFS